MTDISELLRLIKRDLDALIVPTSIDEVKDRLGFLPIGLKQNIPIVASGTRMFRVRKMDHKPSLTTEVGAPPPESSLIGRLNNEGESVLYLADSPDTAFAEARALSGDFCLSEWRVNVPKLAMANGGMPPAMLVESNQSDVSITTHIEEMGERKLDLFREIYTLRVEAELSLYRWSIACGMVNGFSHRCERLEVELQDGNTKWTGRYPFAAIAYPSVRSSRPSINYALNDLGRSCVVLNHVQWVRRFEDGSFTSIDFADSWDANGQIIWQNRPARFQLKQGEQASLTRIAENMWTYEAKDGNIPWFA